MAQDNKAKASIEFDIEDIPIIWHALNIQASTDMMYGNEGKLSRERSRQRAKDLADRYPALCNHGINEYGWLNGVLAARKAKEVSITQKTELDWNHYIESGYKEKRVNKEWLRTHPTILTVDNVPYVIVSDRTPYDKTRLENLRSILEQVVPVDCKLHPIAEPKLD